MTNRIFFRFQNRRMKHKKDTSNVKSVNKPSKSPALTADSTHKFMREPKASSNDCHQDIVKRLMTHSQYFPASPNSKPVAVTYSNPPMSANIHTQYPITPQYPTYNHQVYDTNQTSFADYFSKDFYYQPQQQSYNQFSNINTCLSPSLSSPSTLNNFDQISNGSPRSSNYVFNGDFTLNFNADFDGSFPLADGAKTEQLFDNQAPLEIKSFDAVSSIGQLTPVTIEFQRNEEIKKSFEDVKNIDLVNFSDDDILSCSSRPSPPSATAVDWKFTDHQ